MFTGEKYKTRRAPPCLHCKMKWHEHGDYNTCEKLVGDQLVSLNHFYKPDLSRWQPKGMADLIDEKLNIADATKFLAICPGRGKAAICANCGGWKEWHVEKLTDKAWKEMYDAFPGWCILADLKICDNYEPLRRMVVKVEMEIDWWAAEFKRQKEFHSLSDYEINGLIEADEARAEGGKSASWAWLRKELEIYPKGTPLAIIEFEKRAMP